MNFISLVLIFSSILYTSSDDSAQISCSSANSGHKIKDDKVICPLNFYNASCDHWWVITILVFQADNPLLNDHFHSAIAYLNQVNGYCQSNSRLIASTPSYSSLGRHCNDPLPFGEASNQFIDSIQPKSTQSQHVMDDLNEMLEQVILCVDPMLPFIDLSAGALYIFTDIDCAAVDQENVNRFIDQLQSIMMEAVIVRIVLFGNIKVNDCAAYLSKCLNCTMPNCALVDGAISSSERTCSIDDPHVTLTTSTSTSTSTTSPHNTWTTDIDSSTLSAEPASPSTPPATSSTTTLIPGGNKLPVTELALAIGIPCAVFVLCCGICACCCVKCSKLRQRTMERIKGRWRGDRTMTNSSYFGKVSAAPNFDSFAAAKHYMDIEQLAIRNKKDCWEVPTKNVIIHENEILGSGAFSNVYRGTLIGKVPLLNAKRGVSLTLEHQTEGHCETAVKRLPPHADEQNRMDFFHEIDFMKRLGYHVHIIAMLGCVSDAWDPLILVEYCHYGDMLRFLRNRRSSILTCKDDVCPAEADMCLRIKELVSFAWQISDGMSYLCSKNFIHRDLAARNVLLTKNLVAKVSDFGLCRYIDSALYTAKGGKLPIKWMAVESLKFYEYSFKTDVWAYGVALFEIFSLGDGPYQAIQPLDMLSHLERGNRLAQPERCPNEIYALMMRCWAEKADDRPTFNQIRKELTAILNMDDEHYGYLSMGDDGPPTTRSIDEVMERQNVANSEKPPNEEVIEKPTIPDRPPKKGKKEAGSGRRKR